MSDFDNVKALAEQALADDRSRTEQLASRLVAPGPKAAHVSASETHEIAEALQEMNTREPQLATAVLDLHAENDRLRAQVEDDAFTKDFLRRSHAMQSARRDEALIQLAEAKVEVSRLTTRRDELLAVIARISQTVPLESEVSEALTQRGAMLAEIGTLRARVTELEKGKA